MTLALFRFFELHIRIIENSNLVVRFIELLHPGGPEGDRGRPGGLGTMYPRGRGAERLSGHSRTHGQTERDGVPISTLDSFKASNGAVRW